MSHSFALGLCALVPLAAPAASQEPYELVRVGDSLPGVGTVTGVVLVRVDELGNPLVHVTTDDPSHPEAILRNGVVWRKVGDPSPVGNHPGATIAGFGNFSWELFGGLIWNMQLAGTLGGSSDNQGVAYEGWGSLQTGQDSSWYSNDFPPGTVWTSFDDVQFGALSFDGILRGTVDDPLVPGSRESFIATAHQYGSIGVCCLVGLIAEEGHPASAAVTELIEEVRLTRWSAVVGPDFDFALWSCDLEGPVSSDGAVFRTMLPSYTDTLIAREGSPSPIAGRLWGSLESPSLDANSHGHWTMRARLDASDPSSDEVVILNDAKYVQEGDAHPAVAPFLIDGLGSGRAQLTGDGRVVWYASWNDPSAPSEALFLEDEPLVRAGVTTVGGVPLVGLASGPDAFDVSVNSQYVIFRGTLAGGVEGAFFLDRGGMKPYCLGKKNSADCYPHLTWSGDIPSASLGAGFVIEAVKILGQVPGMFFYGTTGRQNVPFAGGSLCVVPPLLRIGPKPTGGGLPTTCTGTYKVDFNSWVASGADPTLVAGQDVFAQVWYRDPGYAPPNDLGLTNALQFFLMP